MDAPTIKLRPVVSADLPIFYEHHADAEAIKIAMPASETSEWDSFLAKWRRILSSREFLCRTVLCQEVVAGYVAHFEQVGNPSVSYWFGHEFWGRGVATEALGQFIAAIQPRPLFARVALANKASLKVLERNGFNIVENSSYYSASHQCEIAEAVLRLD